MHLYEITEQIKNLITFEVDEETGEIIEAVLDQKAFDEWNTLLDEKLEGLAMWAKNELAMAGAIREEEKTLAGRRKQHERTAESLRKTVERYLAGRKLETPRISCTFRASERVEETGEERTPTEYLRMKYEPDKTKIKQAIKSGETVAGWKIVRESKMSIK